MIYSDNSREYVPVYDQFRVVSVDDIFRSKSNLKRILILRDPNLPLRNGVSNSLPISTLTFPSRSKGSRKRYVVRTGRSRHSDTYLRIKRSSHSLRGDILSYRLFTGDLSDRFTSSFEVNRFRFFLKQFENSWCHWFDTNFGIDTWTHRIPLGIFQYHTWLRYPSHCSSTDDPLEILFGYMYYLENQVRNDSLKLLNKYLKSYHESNLPLFLLNEDLGRFKDWDLVFTNVDKLHYYTPNKHVSLDPLQGNRTNSIIGEDRVILTMKDNTLLSFLNHWTDIGNTLTENLIKNFSDEYMYVGTLRNILTHNYKLQALGLSIVYILMVFRNLEIIPGIKIKEYHAHKSYLQTLHLTKPIGLSLEINSFKLDSLLEWFNRDFFLIKDNTLDTDEVKVESRIRQWRNRFYGLVSGIISKWSLNPFTLFLINFLFLSMNLYLMNFMWWVRSIYNLILLVQNNDNQVMNWSVYVGCGLNRSIPTRALSSTNKQHEMYINDVWSSMFLRWSKDPVVFNGADMIQNVCDYYRENLNLQSSNLDLYTGIRLSIRGDIQFNTHVNSAQNKGLIKGISRNVIVLPSEPDNSVSLFDNPSRTGKFQIRTLVWNPFSPLNFGDNDREKFQDWYSDINFTYRFTQIKIPNVFLFKNKDGSIDTLSRKEEDRLSKNSLEDYASFYALAEDLREIIKAVNIGKESKDKESNASDEVSAEDTVRENESADKVNESGSEMVVSDRVPDKEESGSVEIPEIIKSAKYEKLADYKEPLSYGYKFFVYNIREISGFRRTHLLSYSQLPFYVANTLLFPFIEIPHNENETLVDLICKYDYRIIFSTRFGESFYHRTGDMRMNDGFIHLSFNSLRRRMQLGNSDPIHLIFLQGCRDHDAEFYDNALPKFFLPVDLQFILEDKDAQALEISNNWIFKPLSLPFDVEFKHESVSSNIYDDTIFVDGKNLSLRVREKGKHYEVHSFNKNRFSVGIVFLLSKFKDLSFKLNVKVNLTLTDLALNDFGKNQNLAYFGFNIIPNPFNTHTLTGNYLRLLGNSIPARGLRLIGDFFLILRALMYSRIIGDSNNFFNFYNYRLVDSYSKFLWGRYNGIEVDLSIFLFNFPKVVGNLLKDGHLNTDFVYELANIMESIARIKDPKFSLVQRILESKDLILKVIPIVITNMYPIAKLLVTYYPRYFLTKFLIPYFRPDLYLQYLNLMLELNFKILLKISYYNVIYVQLLSLIMNIPKDMIDSSGRIEIMRFNLYQLLWHYWFSKGDNLKILFAERSFDADYKEIGIGEIKRRPSLKWFVLGTSHKKISIDETINKIYGPFNWYYFKGKAFWQNVTRTLRGY